MLTPVLGSVSGVLTLDRAVALTFDDGPHPIYTPRLLDVLAMHNAKATFFVLGSAAQKYPWLIARMHAEGHEIGNHSWDHPSLPTLSVREQRDQIIRAHGVLAPYGARFFRPPFGHQRLVTTVIARALGYEIAHWTFHVEDWLDQGYKELAARLLRGTKPGAIVLLHDRLEHWLTEKCADRSSMVQAVETLLETSKEYEFVTLSALRCRGRTVKKLTCKEPDRVFLQRLNTGDPT